MTTALGANLQSAEATINAMMVVAAQWVMLVLQPQKVKVYVSVLMGGAKTTWLGALRVTIVVTESALRAAAAVITYACLL
jgi:hypothetical protein